MAAISVRFYLELAMKKPKKKNSRKSVTTWAASISLISKKRLENEIIKLPSLEWEESVYTSARKHLRR